MCLYVWAGWVCAFIKHKCMLSPDENIQSPEAGVMGSCELPNLGAGN